MNRRFIGSILLIAGTSIGAGMLALPVVLAVEGFITTIFLLLGCWVVMVFGAFLILEANLWLSSNSNMVSMAKATLGNVGQTIAWIVYLLLLYSLLCAYISSMSDVVQHILLGININAKPWVSAAFVVLVFAGIVYCGMRTVDVANRLLVAVKFGAYALLIFMLVPHVSIAKLLVGKISVNISTLTVIIASFGFATIVPSLRVYLKGDVRKLKLAILIGSLIPLLLYLLWIAVVQGTVHKQGAHGLLQVAASAQVTSSLISVLSQQVQSLSFSSFVHIFIDVCVTTSCLGVSLCLTDFLSDGLQLRKTGKEGAFVYLFAYTPPLIVVIFAPGIFIKALSYAGIYVLFCFYCYRCLWFGMADTTRKFIRMILIVLLVERLCCR